MKIRDYSKEDRMKKNINVIIAVICLISLNSLSFAQGFNASGLAMGGAYGALARGTDAFAWNPANLALSYDKKLEINLVGLNLNAANSTLTIDQYERYFTESGHGGYWDDQEIRDILKLIPDDGLDANIDAKANVFGLLFGRYGFSVQGMGKAMGVIPKSMFELFLKGNDQLYKNYHFNDFNAEGFAAIKLSLSLSHPIPFKKYFDEFGVGLNINYYSGIGVFEVLESEGSFVTTNNALLTSMNIVTRNGQGGTGMGFDVGAAGRIKDKWSVSLALNNLFAGIKWKRELEVYKYTSQIDTIQIEDINELEEAFEEDTLKIDPFRTSLPVVFHLGLAYDLYENLTFALDLEQAFEKKIGYSDKGQLSIGVQYSPIKMIPLRAGMTFGGKWKYLMGLGFGLHLGFFHLDLAYAMHQGLWPTKTSGTSVAANIKIAL
jgi:hypothetical protein